MTDSITLTKEQFEAWFIARKSGAGPFSGFADCFDSLKAFVEKPKRRDWVLESPEGKIYFLEELPGDVGPMTNDEAVKWVMDALHKMYESTTFKQFARRLDYTPKEFEIDILKALGLT